MNLTFLFATELESKKSLYATIIKFDCSPSFDCILYFLMKIVSYIFSYIVVPCTQWCSKAVMSAILLFMYATLFCLCYPSLHFMFATMICYLDFLQDPFPSLHFSGRKKNYMPWSVISLLSSNKPHSSMYIFFWIKFPARKI